MDLISLALTIVMYVLQGLSLQCIARRRGIRNDWLAWVPVGSVWILGAIADDYRRRTCGGTPRLRVWLVILVVLTLVLGVLLLISLGSEVLPILTKAVSEEDLVAYYEAVYYGPQDMYSEPADVLMEQMLTQMKEKLTEQDAERLFRAVMGFMGTLFLMSCVALALTVLEYICQYRLFASCEPRNKVLYLILSIWLGVGSVCMFVCRNKDQGLPPVFPGLPGGGVPGNGWQQPPYQLPPCQPPQEPPVPPGE